MKANAELYDSGEAVARKPAQINFKRVLARVLRFWYLIVISFLVAVVVAFVVNRYTTRIYPVRASILIKQNEESTGAKFLYNNELVNPYRNFFNEIYIMKSYPLLQEVVESLNFDVSLYREGDIKTTEYYSHDFPVEFRLTSPTRGSGNLLKFTITNESTFSISYPDQKSASFSNLSFDTPVEINGFSLLVKKKGDTSPYVGQTYLIAFHDPIQLAKAYSGRLQVSWAQQGASVVDLVIHGAVAQKEIDFLSKFIERYQRYDVEKKNRVSTMAMKFLDNQLNVIGDSLKLYEDQVEMFKRRNVTTDITQETGRLYEKMIALEDQKFQYRLHESYSKYISELLTDENYDGMFTPSNIGMDDEVLSHLVTQLIDEQSQINLYISNAERGVDKTEQNPVLQAKRQRLNLLKKDILKAIANAQSVQGINVRYLNDQIGFIKEQLQRLPGTERELIAIQRNYSLRENLYVFLLQKRAEAGLSEASTTSDIVLVNQPVVGAAITPKVLVNYGVAISLGLLLPLLFFVAAEVMNNRVQSREDIEQHTSVSILGGVGHNPESESLVVVNRPKSAMTEAFRALRSNLNYYTSNQSKQVFMVTSSIPGEGKSFTTLNLAAVFAMAGKRTLIIGADLRKPRLYEELRLENKLGLSQYLSSMATLPEIVQKSGIENLYLISGGALAPNPSELLLKPAMAQLIEESRKAFDCIVLDTPPLGLVTDAFVLAPLVNHTLFVVRQDYTPRFLLQALEEYYSNGKLSNVSILFNDLRKTGPGYGYGNYGYNYGYGQSYGYPFRYGEKKSDYYSD